MAQAVEALERRWLLTGTITAQVAGGNWNSTSTWVGGVVPGSGNDVVIPAGSHVTVTDGESAQSLNTAVGSSLAIQTGPNGAIGDLNFDSPAGGPVVSKIAGSLEVDATTIIAGNNAIFVNLAGTTTLAGTLEGDINNTGTMAISNEGGVYGATFTNDGTVTVSGGISLGMSGNIINEADGTFNLTDDSSFFPTTYPVTDTGGFTNKGLFEKTGGTGTSYFYQTVPSQVVQGTFSNVGGTISIQSGTFVDAGTTYLQNTTFSVATGSSFQVKGFTPNTDTTVGITGTVTGSGGGTVVFATGDLKPAGPDGTGIAGTLNFPAGMASITGAAVDSYNAQYITNAGSLDFNDTSLTGSVNMINTGTVNVIGPSDVPLIDLNNAATGVVNLKTDAGFSQATVNIAHNLYNYGTLEKTGGTGTSVIGANLGNFGGSIVVNTGSISLQAGNMQTYVAGPLTIATGSTLVFDGGSSTSISGTMGPITGGGIVDFVAGTFTSPPVYDAADGTAPGVLNFAPGTFIDKGGVFDFGNNGLTNTGTIDFQGSTTIHGFINAGTLSFDAGPIDISGTLTNQAAGVIDFTADTTDGTVTMGALLNNAGRIVKSGGTGTLKLPTQVANKGTIEAASGTIQLASGDQAIFGYDTQNNREILAGQTLQVDAGAAITLDTALGTKVIGGTVILGGAGASFPELGTVTTIAGTGTLSVLSGATFASAGSIADMGTLTTGGAVTINGDLTESHDATVTTAPTLGFAVAAASGSAAAPALHVTGATTLAGNLNVAVTGNLTIAAGTKYTVATFATAATGAFAATDAADFTVTVNPTNIVLNSSGSTTPTPTPTPTPTSTGTLVPTILRSTVPTDVVGTVHHAGAVAVRVTNNASAAITGKDAITLYATAAGVVDSSSLSLRSVTKSLPLKAGKFANLSLAVQTQTLPAGTYVLVVQTTTPAGVTTLSPTTLPLVVETPVVTLSATVAALSPASPRAGKTATVTVKLSNTGNFDSTAALSIAIGLSTDGTTLAIPISTATVKPRVKAHGAPVTVKLHIKIPADVTASTYYPFVTVTATTPTAQTITAVGAAFTPIV